MPGPPVRNLLQSENLHGLVQRSLRCRVIAGFVLGLSLVAKRFNFRNLFCAQVRPRGKSFIDLLNQQRTGACEGGRGQETREGCGNQDLFDHDGLSVELGFSK